jgi:hypothetical protein
LRIGAPWIGVRCAAVLGGLRGAFGLSRRPLRLLEGEGRARRLAAGQQISAGDEAGAGAIQFGQQRAARIRGDGGDRSGARTETEPMQGERSVGFGIEGHASGPFGRDAMPPPQQEASSATAVSRLRRATFRQNGRGMKNPKGDRERLQGDTVVERRAATHLLGAPRPTHLVCRPRERGDPYSRDRGYGSPLARGRRSRESARPLYHSANKPMAMVTSVSGAPTLK